MFHTGLKPIDHVSLLPTAGCRFSIARRTVALALLFLFHVIDARVNTGRSTSAFVISVCDIPEQPTMSRYVPPHLRNAITTASSSVKSSAKTHVDSEDAAIISTRRTLEQLALSTPRLDGHLHTCHEIQQHFGSTGVRSTLNNSGENPQELAYVILFHGANPRWEDDRILFAHTQIELLPGYGELDKEGKLRLEYQDAGIVRGNALNKAATSQKLQQAAGGQREAAHLGDEVSAKVNSFGVDEKRETLRQTAVIDYERASLSRYLPSKPASASSKGPAMATAAPSDEPVECLTRAIPVFSELRRGGSSRKYAFSGYYTIGRTEFLLPHSTELVRMLEQKWNAGSRQPHPRHQRKGGERDPEAWARSLAETWAVVKMPPLGDLTKEPPNIAILEEACDGF